MNLQLWELEVLTTLRSPALTPTPAAHSPSKPISYTWKLALKSLETAFHRASPDKHLYGLLPAAAQQAAEALHAGEAGNTKQSKPPHTAVKQRWDGVQAGKDFCSFG